MIKINVLGCVSNFYLHRSCKAIWFEAYLIYMLSSHQGLRLLCSNNMKEGRFILNIPGRATTVKLEGDNKAGEEEEGKTRRKYSGVTILLHLASLLSPFNTNFISFLNEAFAATLAILSFAHY